VQLASTIALWTTTLLLTATTLWRLRKPIDAALLVPGAWLVAIPYQALLLAGKLQFTGTPKDNMYIGISIANLGFVGFQALAELGVIARLQERVRRLAASRGGTERPGTAAATVRYWFGGLLVVAVALAVLHWALMPEIPLLLLVTGANDQHMQLARENSAKLLAAPALLKYAFAWNSRIFFPILLTTAVLFRWRWTALLVGAFGLLYITSSLEKLPSVLFMLGPFIGLAIRDGKRLWSPVVLVGLVVSLIPAYGINQAISLEARLHPAPVSATTATPTPPPNVSPVSPGSEFKGFPAPIRGALDLVLRRIGEAPTDVTYNWFAYFPEHHSFLNGAGWEPWNVLRPGWQSPANLVGLWAYYGKQGYTLISLSAYGSFVADGWGEFGMAGVVIATLLLLLFALVLELMHALADRLFCLACYTVGLVLMSVMSPQAGIPALMLSNGLALAPLIMLGYLLFQGRQTGVREVKPVRSPA
jgi:hypothetical protein